ncbi:MAG: Ig-like domain-containing protein [Endomicrobia bacterium]|nr:Ig-like domain-containing protein [Endomicrobiia bacterium]
MKKILFYALCSMMVFAAAFTICSCEAKDSVRKSTNTLYVYPYGWDGPLQTNFVWLTDMSNYPMTVVLKDIDGNDITAGTTVTWSSNNTNILYFNSPTGNPGYMNTTLNEGTVKVTVTCGGVKNIFTGYIQNSY